MQQCYLKINRGCESQCVIVAACEKENSGVRGLGEGFAHDDRFCPQSDGSFALLSGLIADYDNIELAARREARPSAGVRTIILTRA